MSNQCLKCECKQGSPSKDDPRICVCGHSHFHHEITIPAEFFEEKD